MKPEIYIKLVNQNKIKELNTIIKGLSDSEIIALRTELETQGETRLLRPLYFNYSTQKYI